MRINRFLFHAAADLGRSTMKRQIFVFRMCAKALPSIAEEHSCGSSTKNPFRYQHIRVLSQRSGA
jgi:hypothetical protein